jgi:hypothetical protein
MESYLKHDILITEQSFGSGSRNEDKLEDFSFIFTLKNSQEIPKTLTATNQQIHKKAAKTMNQ